MQIERSDIHNSSLLEPTLMAFTMPEGAERDPHGVQGPFAGNLYCLGDKMYLGFCLGVGSIVRAEVPAGSGRIQQLRVSAIKNDGVVTVPRTQTYLLRKSICDEAGEIQGLEVACVGNVFNVKTLTGYYWAPR